MYIIEYIQMGLLFVVVPALILLLIYFKRKELNKIDTPIKDFLKKVPSEPMQASEIATLPFYSDAELVKQPAFVHSTSSLSTSYGNRTAYLVYYDRKKDRLRAETVTINKFEKENGRLHAGEFVLVVIEKRKLYIQCVSILKKL